MRPLADQERIRRFMDALGRERSGTFACTWWAERPRSSSAGVLGRRLIEPGRAVEYFERTEPQLHRFPAIDHAGFRRAVKETFGPEES